MKKRIVWLFAAVAALGLTACNKKEEPKPASAPVSEQAPAAEPVPPPVPPPAEPAKTVPALSGQERAAKLGFAAYLPQDIEMMLAVHNGLKTADRISSSKLWRLLNEEAGMGGPPIMPQEELRAEAASPQPSDEDDEDADEPGMPGNEPLDNEPGGMDGPMGGPDMPAGDEPMAGGPAELLGAEFTIAIGKGAGAQGANLLKLVERLNYFQMRQLVKSFAVAAKAGDLDKMEPGNGEMLGVFKDLLADPQSEVAMLDLMTMPPLYLAFKTTAETRAGVAQQLAGAVENLAMFEEITEPVDIEAGGAKFAGQKISGAKIAESIKDNREDLEGMLEPAKVDQLLAAIAKKNLVVVSGVIGDYATIFIGASTDDLKFAASPAQSLAGSEAMAFCDGYVDKELAAVMYGQKGAIDQIVGASTGVAEMAAGLRDGLAGAEGLGDTRDLEALLRMVAEREAALRKLAGPSETLGAVAYFDNGLQIESFGGVDQGALNWDQPNKLAALGEGPDVVMFANMTSEAAYDEKAREYLEALMETIYAMAMKVSDLKVDDPSVARYKEMLLTFDRELRPDAVALWDVLAGDFSGSLGRERACVMDLNGAVPAIPGIPQQVVDGGKFPRITLVAPVVDRPKLAASWDKINASATSLLAKFNKVAGTKVPMQKPVSSEKNGYTTWFFSLGTFSDDFMPSVTVGDKWFAASSSKNQALDLLAKADTAGTGRKGMYLTVNFQALQKFAEKTRKLIEENSAEIFGEAGAHKQDLVEAGKVIAALDDLDKLTVYSRREGGKLRSSIHLKTR